MIEIAVIMSLFAMIVIASLAINPVWYLAQFRLLSRILLIAPMWNL